MVRDTRKSARVKPKKIRLDEYLVGHELCSDLRIARSLIIDHKVVVNGKVCSKPGTAVSSGAEVHIRGQQLQFASRGGYKLAHALPAFGIDGADRVVLDAGASTGGFTDCLLQAGARLVYSVDVGYGQLKGSLAHDDRVVALERANISDLSVDQFEYPLDLIVVDLSYISLRKAIPILAPLMKEVRMVCLVKPMYEGLPQALFENVDATFEVLEKLLHDLLSMGIPIADITVSPYLGGRGAVEFFLLIESGTRSRANASFLIEKARREYEAMPPSSHER